MDIEKIKARINEIDRLLDFAGCGQIIILETGGVGGGGNGDVRKELLEERKFLKILLRIAKD